MKVDIAQIRTAIEETLEEILNQVCDLIVGYAQINVLVDTGSLRDSIRKERGGEGLGWKLFRVRAGGYMVNPRTGKLVDYASYVESHTPFLQPAVDMVQPEIYSMLVGKLADKLGNVNVTITSGQ